MKKLFAAVLAALTVIGSAGAVSASPSAIEDGAPIYAYHLSSDGCATYYYTTDPDEASKIGGWSSVKEVGIIGYSDSREGAPVYRLRCQKSNLPAMYAYAGADEVGAFQALGYTSEGPAFYQNSGTAKIYRLHNPNQKEQYMFTPDSGERDFLLNSGWSDEGVLELADLNYQKVPAYYQEPEQINGRFIDEKMDLSNENCRLASIDVSGIRPADYELTVYEGSGQRGVKFRTAGAAEKAVVTARFTDAGTYRSGTERIPIDYTLTFSHGVAYATGSGDYYRPKRAWMEKGEFGLYFSENPSLASILNFGFLSVDCEMKLYRSSDGKQITPSGAYLTFGSLNGFHDYEQDHYYDVEGVCALAPVSRAYVTGDTILRTGTYENYDRYMDPNNKGRSGYYGWQSSVSDFQDGKSSKAVTYNRSCVTLVFDSSIRFAIQTYETRMGKVHWSLDTFPIGNTPPDSPVKSAEHADGSRADLVRKGQELIYRIDQKVNVWAENGVSKYTAFEIRDTIPDGTAYRSAELLCDGKMMDSASYSVLAEGQKITCSLSDRYLLDMPMKGETYTLVIRCEVTADGGRTMKNRAVSYINHSEFSSNEVTVTVQKTHTIKTRVENGTIDAAMADIPEGEDRTVHYAPMEGYALQSITVDGVPLKEKERKQYESSYLFSDIQADHEITVVYSKKNIPLNCEKRVFFEDGKTDADGKIVPVGKPLVYQIAVSGGNGRDETITVTDPLPDHMKFHSADRGGTLAGNQIRWIIPAPKNGESQIVSFTAIPEKAGALYENHALVSAAGQKDAETNPVRSWTIAPEKTVADEKGNNLDRKTAAVGQTILYRISFENPLPVKSVFTVKDVMPEETGYVSSTRGGTFADGAVLWKAEIGAGETFTAELRVRIIRSGKFVNRASVSSGLVTAETNPVTVYAYRAQRLPNAGDSGALRILIAAALASAAAAGLDLRRRK